MSATPDFIGRFRVESLLGRGAMGVVFKAHDPDIDRTVAIKLVRMDLLAGDDCDHYIARFRNEAKMAGRCIHPNIVGIHDFAMHEGSPFLVLEYVDGKDLVGTYGRDVQVDLASAVHIALRVLEALAYAHQFGVIHRDIKPANILLTGATGVKVTDFGISRALASDATLSSVLVGTPCYMSPEQCLGGVVDARSDVFSLGCVLYEMLAGQRSFAGSNYVATMHNVLHEAPPALQERRPDIPDAVVQVVDKALAKRPEDRFQSAKSMAQALGAALLGPLAEDGDPTVVVSRHVPPAAGRPLAISAPPELDALNAASLATIERRLAHHVGPMARYHLRSAVRAARTVEQLGQLLVDLVPPGQARDGLERDIIGIVTADSGRLATRSDATPPPPAATVSSSAAETLTRALTRIIGPIAPRMVAQALRTATTPEALEAACLEMIDSGEERERFRKMLARQ